MPEVTRSFASALHMLWTVLCSGAIRTCPRQESNLRPQPSEGCALSNLSYEDVSLVVLAASLIVDSNHARRVYETQAASMHQRSAWVTQGSNLVCTRRRGYSPLDVPSSTSPSRQKLG